MHKKWTQIQEILANSLGRGRVKVWIEPLNPCFDENGLTLYAPTEFAAMHLRGALMPQIEAAARAALGGVCRVRVLQRPGSGAQLVPGLNVVAQAQGASSVVAPAPGLQAGAVQATDSAAGVEALLSFDDGQVLNEKAGPGALNEKAGATPEQSPALLGHARPEPRPLSAQMLCLPGGAGNAPRPAEPCWRFSFEDFVVGPSNELAYAASKSLSAGLLNAEVLFLCSAPGLGKTHLMQAVGRALFASCTQRRPRAEYLTAEEFTSRFFAAIKAQDTMAFKARYRELDLLLLEDVHFLQGKEKTQDELLATIKAVRDRGGRVVFSSSFAPRELKLMDEQLSSRLGSGLLSFIERPDEETRRRIFRRKAALHQVLLPEDVEDMLSHYISKDVRQIESCLQTLILKARLLNSRITTELAWEVLSQYAAASPVLDMDAIIDSICRAFSLTPEHLSSAARRQEYVLARNAAYYLARKHTDLSLEEIGRRFNRRHSTVLKGITNIEREMSRQTPQGCRVARTLQLIEKNGNIFSA